MEDLVGYLNASGHPPVLRAVVAHSQFETIHPFGDGNGRTGRALIQTVLNAAGLADGAVPVSSALSRDQRGYYDALNASRVVCDAADTTTRSRGLRGWLTAFTDACVEAERQAAAVARRVEAMADRWQTVAVFRRDSAAAAVLSALPSMPVLDAETAAQRVGVTPRAARAALAALAEVGIVSSTGGRRNRRYTVPEMVALLRATTPDGGLAASTRPGPTPHASPASAPVSAADAPAAPAVSVSAADAPAAPAVSVSGPDAPAGPAVSVSAADAPAAPAVPVSGSACGHYGPRTERLCWLPQGHSGQHRYPPD